MKIYIILFLCVLGAALLNINQDSAFRKKIPWFIAVLMCAVVCGLRDMLGGYDNYIYGEVFDVTARYLRDGTLTQKFWDIPGYAKEPGYGVWNVLVALISQNRYIFFFCTSSLFFTMLCIHCNKYSQHPNLSFFFFFCFFYFFTFTYLRQVIAVGIVGFSITYAIKRKPIPFFLIVVLAASVHNSAALFAVVYFVADKQLKTSTMLHVLLLLLLLGFTPAGNLLFKLSGGFADEGKINAVVTRQHVARFEYFLEAAVFFFYIKYAEEKLPKDKTNLCMLNIAYVFIGALCFFIRFSDGGRLVWFFLIGIVCTMASISRTNKGVISFSLVVLFFWLYYRILFGWGPLLNPYKSCLTNGVQNKYSSRRYEYDHKYDKNKFYKW